ncbi:hypothetical protein NDU88_002450 [Pleurodeles waltl]|uniref:Uncharacterized protein n=1 Tax=Pleurodeles waltl TaxID=8319 RepID=A0AAV7VDU6_PLEWA|nr:hypothetical protein NDU88_002450 [Pleurodeles waltl]
MRGGGPRPDGPDKPDGGESEVMLGEGGQLSSPIVSTMGRTDAKQQKLHFGAKKHTGAPPDQVEEDAWPPLQDAQSGLGEMNALLLIMQSSLSSIDGKMDTMTTRLDLLTAGLEKQSGRITEAEQRISNVEDVMQKRQEQLSQMDKLLKVIALKNDDLEARSRRNNIRIVGIPESRSRRNNIRIVGIPESINTGRMEQFMEQLLFALFGEEAFSRLLIME